MRARTAISVVREQSADVRENPLGVDCLDNGKVLVAQSIVYWLNYAII